MDFSKYIINISYPKEPVKPVPNFNQYVTCVEVKNFAAKLEKYEKDMEIFKKEEHKYKLEFKRINDVFFDDCINDLSDKFSYNQKYKIFIKVWDSKYQFVEIYDKMKELEKFLLDFIKGV